MDEAFELVRLPKELQVKVFKNITEVGNIESLRSVSKSCLELADAICWKNVKVLDIYMYPTEAKRLLMRVCDTSREVKIDHRLGSSGVIARMINAAMNNPRFCAINGLHLRVRNYFGDVDVSWRKEELVFHELFEVLSNFQVKFVSFSTDYAFISARVPLPQEAILKHFPNLSVFKANVFAISNTNGALVGMPLQYLRVSAHVLVAKVNSLL